MKPPVSEIHALTPLGMRLHEFVSAYNEAWRKAEYDFEMSDDFELAVFEWGCVTDWVQRHLVKIRSPCPECMAVQYT